MGSSRTEVPGVGQGARNDHALLLAADRCDARDPRCRVPVACIDPGNLQILGSSIECDSGIPSMTATRSHALLNSSGVSCGPIASRATIARESVWSRGRRASTPLADSHPPKQARSFVFPGRSVQDAQGRRAQCDRSRLRTGAPVYDKDTSMSGKPVHSSKPDLQRRSRVWLPGPNALPFRRAKGGQT